LPDVTFLPPRAVVFDLGGTLLDWPDWDADSLRRWSLSYDYLLDVLPRGSGAEQGSTKWPAREEYVQAMRGAELAHWDRVVADQWSGPPSGVLHEGFRRLGLRVVEQELIVALDGYAQAVAGWAIPFDDSVATLTLLRERGYRVGLLSNTWWAAEWHNADLATHGLAPLLDEIVYTSDLPHSKPHPSVFAEVAGRLGVEPAACVMVGDRMVDDISGGLAAGMRAVWRENESPFPKPESVRPTATIHELSELPDLLRGWGGA
jgi:putative hydrolase of the HAD superfamily